LIRRPKVGRNHTSCHMVVQVPPAHSATRSRWMNFSSKGSTRTGSYLLPLPAVRTRDWCSVSVCLDIKGKYWELATQDPDKWAKWIVLRTNDTSDWTFREIKDTPGFKNFNLVDHYPFADIYQLKTEYWDDVVTEPILGKQK